ncbi:MAG: hypothetical protein MUF38_14810 [Anaerolineae bacterium]|jgi:hypothetical protein|nr:hypothetical protein [Anaerolineae bacterium]
MSKRDERGRVSVFEQLAKQAPNIGQMSMSDSLAAYTGGATAVAPTPDGGVQIGDFTLTAVGLRGGESASFEDWMNVGGVLHRMESGMQFNIGDWFNLGEWRWGDKYRSAAMETGYKEKTLREYSYVCRAVDLSIRMDKLSFGHHQAVAALDPDAQRYWLNYAVEHSLSVSKLRSAMQAETDKVTPDWWADWFMPKLDGLAARARKATQVEREAAAAELRRLADELEGRR